MTRVDLHAHVIPDAYRELLITPDGGRPFVPVAPVDELVATMERYEIDAAVISTGPPGAFLGDQGRANETARAANEAIATIVRFRARALRRAGHTAAPGRRGGDRRSRPRAR